MGIFDKVSYADIGSHKLAYRIDGPKRKPDQPVFIVFPGITSSILDWAAVQRHLNNSTPILWYERAGYSLSGDSPDDPTSTNIASELEGLLRAAKIALPYLLIGHSWGGVLSREFMELRPHDIRGVLLIDTVASYKIPDPNISAVNEDVDYVRVAGIDKTHQLTEEEWQALMQEEQSPRHTAQAMKELAQLGLSNDTLNQKQQLYRQPPLLGDDPVVVMRAHGKEEFEKLYAAGVSKGSGTEEQRAAYRDILSGWDEGEEAASRALFGLSTNSRYIRVSCGHNVQYQDPRSIVDEIWGLIEQSTKVMGWPTEGDHVC